MSNRKSAVPHRHTSPQPEVTEWSPGDNIRLCRSETDKMIAGVCGGIAEYFNIDSSLIRLIFLVIILLGGSGIFIYIFLWLVLPLKSETGSPNPDRDNDPSEAPTQTSTSRLGGTRQGKNMWGVFLIGIGIVLLLQNFGFARYLYLDKTWPVMLVLLGLLILNK